MPELNVRKGSSVDTLSPFGAVSLKGDIKTAAQLRAELKLQKVMVDADVFLNTGHYPLAKASEAATNWDELVADQVISILSKPANARAAIDLPKLPDDKEYWKTEIGAGALPPHDANGISVPQGMDTLPRSAAELGIDEWILIKNNNLLTGLRFDDDGASTASFALVDAPNQIALNVKENAKVEVTTTYSDFQSKLVQSGWTSETASVSSPWASVSVEASQQSMTAKASHKRSTYTTASYNYPRAQLSLNTDKLTLSADFQASVKKALSKSTDDAKRKALEKLFHDYGHFFATEVIIGGCLLSQTSVVEQTSEDEKKTEDKIKASLSAVVGGVTAGASIAHGSSEDSTSSSHEYTDGKTLFAIGGNALIAANVPDWIRTVADFRTWRTMKVTSVIPITDFLDDATQAAIDALVIHSKPLEGKWVRVFDTGNNTGGLHGCDRGFSLYLPRLSDDTPEASQWCYLGQTIDSDYALMVRELHPGSLCKIGGFDGIWNDRGSKFADDYNMWQPNATDATTYYALGSYFARRNGGNNQAAPSLDEVSKLRAVKTDLLVRGKMKTDNNEYLWKWGSGSAYEIIAKDPNSIGIRLYQGLNDGNTNKDVWTLRADAINIINKRGDN